MPDKDLLSDLQQAIQQQSAYQDKRKGVDLSELEAVKSKSVGIQKTSRIALYVVIGLVMAGGGYMIYAEPQDRAIYIFTMVIFAFWSTWRLWQKS